MLCAEENVEESIISLLKARKSGGKQLRLDLQKIGISVSSQSVYNALKRLVQEEVVIKEGTKYLLNYVWLKRLYRFSEPIKTENQDFSLFNPSDLSEGERDVYQFNNLNRAGVFWMHIHQILLDSLESSQIVVLYSTNEWTSAIRGQADAEWAKTAAKSDKLTLFAVGDNNYQNRNYKKDHTSGNLQINVGKTYGFEKGYYMNVFNDYVVELFIPSLIDEKISEIFNKNIGKEELISAVNESEIYNCKVKLVVRKNRLVAKKLFKRISKDFYIPPMYSSPILSL